MTDRHEESGGALDDNWYLPNSDASIGLDADQEPAVRYAGFLPRLVAWLIDAVIISIGFGVLARMMGVGSAPSSTIGVDTGGVLLSLVINWLYGALMESSSNQATVGKMALSLKVTDLSGERITFGRATGRFLAEFVSSVIFLVGFMMAGWTRKKQALHDMLAGTLVVDVRRPS